jgi:UDP-N-acetylglucosamine transferase subunit ALG13
MILVTVGTQFFDELVEEVDRLAGEGRLGDEVLAQIGLSGEPKNVKWLRFTDEIPRLIDEADLVITHAGTGSILQCVMANKRFIAVVNDTKAGNHQMEFVEDLSRRVDFCWIRSPRDLEAVLDQARPPADQGGLSLNGLVSAIRETALASSI